MISIRLKPLGRMNSPFYRIVAIDSHKKVAGYSKATLGYWTPSKKEVKINKKSLDMWLQKGAIVSPAVKKLLAK